MGKLQIVTLPLAARFDSPPPYIGRMSEWLKEAVLKTAVGFSPPRVQIPLRPCIISVANRLYKLSTTTKQ